MSGETDTAGQIAPPRVAVPARENMLVSTCRILFAHAPLKRPLMTHPTEQEERQPVVLRIVYSQLKVFLFAPSRCIGLCDHVVYLMKI